MESLEDKPLYLWDFYFQFSDLLDFLEFSENNIELQRNEHVQILNKNAKSRGYDSGEYHAELQNIEHRFDFNLSRSVKYSAIISLVTTIEWISKFVNEVVFKEGALEKVKRPKKGSGKNWYIEILKEFIVRCDFNKPTNLDKLEKVIKIRNFITHAMGSVKDDRFEAEIKEIINTFEGFSLSDSHFLEEVICINKGTLESIISETQG